jgi:Tfp pilus assembly protein PilW
MKIYKNSKHKGVTVIELLVSVFIVTLIMGAVPIFFKQIFTSSSQKTQFLNDSDESRYIISRFTSEIRSAAYGADGSYPLNQAGDTQIIFFTTLGGSSTTTVKRIRYYVSGNTLYKGIINPSASAPIYNSASEVVISVARDLASTTGSSGFSYYDGNYDGSSTAVAFTQPVNVNLVKYVKLNLSFVKQTNKATSTASDSGGGTIRNLKINLGN